MPAIRKHYLLPQSMGPTDSRDVILRRLAFHRGEIQRHQHAVEATMQELCDLAPERDLTPAEWLDQHVSALGLCVRTANMLETRRLYTVRDLLHTTEADLLTIPGFGGLAMDEVFAALAEAGFVRRRM